MIYDLIVIGGGPAGYHAAEKAGHAGLKVLLFEKKFIGGVCLNEGCVPSKTLLYSAKLLDNSRNGEKYGLFVDNARLDHKKVIERKNKVVRTLVTGIKSALKKSNVEIIEAEAKILGRKPEGFEVTASGNTYVAKRLLLATGSSPVIPPIKGLKEGVETKFAVTSSDIFGLETIPASMTVIGAGIIGLEMASYFNSLGSKVTVIEMLPGIAGNTDSDIASVLMNNYKKKGVILKMNSKVNGITGNKISFEENGSPSELESDCLLVSVGRKANTEGFGLETLGVLTEKGGISTDGKGRTNVKDVYAAGDVNGKSMLAHTAYREAEVCVNDMTGTDDVIRYDLVPSVIYTNPEVAAAGETEDSCKRKNLEYRAVKIPLRFSGRYLAENELGDGICKIIIDKDNRLIGFHMIGNYSSEIIYGLSLMMQKEVTVSEIKRMIFPHPTVSEIIKEGIMQFD
jgi:dihydrolipoamide dehydrogenase